MKISKWQKTPKEWTLLFFHGPESASYLERLSSASPASLPPQKGCVTFFMSAQATLEHMFFLWKIDEKHFFITLDAGPKDAALQSFFQWMEFYHFGEKWSLEKTPKASCRWFIPLVPLLESGSWLCWHKKETLFLLLSAPQPSFFWEGVLELWTLPLESPLAQALLPHAHTQAPFPLAFSSKPFALELEKRRILEGRLWPHKDILSFIHPFELPWGHAWLQKQACYPGQEVIERMLSRAATPKWHAFRFFSQEKLQEGENTLFFLEKNTPQSCGTLTSFCENWALGWVQKKALSQEKFFLKPKENPIFLEGEKLSV